MGRTTQGTAGRFGARFGASLRKKVSEVEKSSRAKKKCPYCNKFGVKRVAMGIWQCRKCDIKFAGKAYDI